MLKVLSNLLGNALKFTPEGGRVRVAAAPDGPTMVRFSVSDTGPGISPDFLPYIFEPFTQAQDTATRGTGLGLSVVKGMGSRWKRRGTDYDMSPELSAASTRCKRCFTSRASGSMRLLPVRASASAGSMAATTLRPSSSAA